MAEVRSAAVAEQFDDLAQQREAYNLGMWVFIATEVLLFGALFLAYTANRLAYPETFAEAGRHLDVPLGSLNTAVLLGSSLTMALAVRAGQLGERRALLGLLPLTMVLGALFLVIKGVEYSHEYEEHLIPGLNFAYEGAHGGQAELFFRFYFLMTGLHAIHLTIGILVAGGMTILAWRQRFNPPHDTPVDLLGLYWHFVDVVWVFLLAALYLIH